MPQVAPSTPQADPDHEEDGKSRSTREGSMTTDDSVSNSDI